MTTRRTNRRDFLGQTGAAAALTLGASLTKARAAAPGKSKLHIACNEYPWGTFARRRGKNFHADLGASIAQVAKSGVDGYEPLASSPESVDRLVPLLKKHGLEMRSLYVNSELHDTAKIAESTNRVLAIARRAKELAGTRIIVTNPSPIGWGSGKDKSDAQLRVQGRALDTLGAKLRGMGLTLSYHNHDAELRQAAREFHHMLAGTDPRNVTFCLDCHWVFRGSGDSTVALFDVLKLYGPRVTELHLRQSVGGVWTEALSDGDIDYRAVARHLLKIGVKPHIVIEQAVEANSPDTMDGLAAHKTSRDYAASVFAAFAS